MAPLHKHNFNAMSNESTDNVSPKHIGAIDKPAVMRRSFIQVVREWFTGRTELVPYNYGQPECPRLKVGDRLIIVSQNESIDLVAVAMRMRDTRYTRRGRHTRWKVIEVLRDGALLCAHKGHRIIDKYLGWSDGNRVYVQAVPFIHSGLEFRVYYERRLSTAA